MKVIVTWGQDTPAYATEEVVVPDDASDEQIVAAVKEKADGVGNIVFDPSYDWTGLRIVDVTKEDGECVANDVAIEPCGEDLGIIARGVLTGMVSPMALLHEAERQGINVHPKVAEMILSMRHDKVAP